MWSVLCGLWLLTLAGWVSADDEQHSFDSLVTQLGEPQFPRREDAEKLLRAGGRRAQAALLRGVDATDLEISRRCRRMMADVLEQDLRDRMTLFGNGQIEAAQLPSWTRFKSSVGNDASARKFFLELLTVEPGLFLASELEGHELLAAVEFRIQQFLLAQQSPDPNRPRVPPPLSRLSLIYFATDPRISAHLNAIDRTMLRSWLHQGDLQNVVRDGEKAPYAARLLTEWVRSGSFFMNGQRIDLLGDAILFDLPEIVPDAIDELRQPKVSISAIEVVARIGGKSYVEALLPALNDKTTVATFQFNNRPSSIQTRDLALAWIVYFTGQDLKQYGFMSSAEVFKQIKQNLYVNVSMYRFNTEEDRDKSHAKLAAWLKKQPLPPYPVPTPQVRQLPPQPVVEAPQLDPEKLAEEDPNRDLGLVFAESFELQRLNRATQMIQQQRWAEAATILADIVRQPHEKWFQPQRGVPQFRELRAEAERLIATLPDEGFAAIERQFGAAARQRFDEARAAGDLAALAQVAREYFATEAGASATYLLAQRDLDAGQVLNAAMRFERLALASRHRAQFEPQLSLLRVVSWLRIGERSHAGRIVAELGRSHPNLEVLVRGELQRLFLAGPNQQPEVSRSGQFWIDSVGRSPEKVGGWLTHRGSLDRNAVGLAVTPWVRGQLLTAVVNSPLLQPPVAALVQEIDATKLGRVPALHPLIVGETIVTRTAADLRAYNVRGDLLWVAASDDTLTDLLLTKNETRRAAQLSLIPDFLKDRLWDDSVYGVLASNGTKVFVVEDDRFDATADYQRFWVGTDGKLRLSMPTSERGNQLLAYDVATGKVLWEAGVGFGQANSNARVMRFLGAPLCFGEALFVIAQQGEEITLRELDAATGTLQRQWPLQTEVASPANVMWGMRGQRGRPSPSLMACTPSYVSGVLLCRTPNNRIVAVDRTSGSLRWAYQPPKPEVQSTPQFFNPVARGVIDAQRRMSVDRWSDASLIVAENRVIAAMPETNSLLCLDLANGSVLWSAPRIDGLYVQGVQDGRVVVVGRTGLHAFQLSDGKPSWPNGQVTWPSAAVPSGMGYLSAGRCVTPLNSGDVIVVDLQHGRIAARSRFDNAVRPGNLVAFKSDIFSWNVDGLRKFSVVEDWLKTAAAQTQPISVATRIERSQALQAAGREADAVAELLPLLDPPIPETVAVRERLIRLIVEANGLRAADRERVLAAIGPKSLSTDERVLIALRTAESFEFEDARLETIDRLLAYQSEFGLLPRNSDPAQLRFETAAWSVRTDRWLLGKISRLSQLLNPADREVFEKKVAQLRSSLTPAEFLARFSDGSDQVRGVRLAFGVDLLDLDSVAAEIALRTEFKSHDMDQQRELLFQLSKHIAPLVGRRGEHWLRLLKEQSVGDDVGSDAVRLSLLEAAFTKANRGLNAVESATWPRAQPKQTQEVLTGPTTAAAGAQVQTANYQSMIPIARHQPEVDAPHWLAFEQSKRKWHLVDAFGRIRGELVGDDKLASFQQGVPQAKQVGALLYLWIGTSLHAFEVGSTETKQLWSTVLIDNQSKNWQTRLVARRVNRMQVFLGARGIRQESRWWPICVQPDYVCYQLNRELLAVEPQTGRVLWKRDDDGHFDCDLIGDETTLCAIDFETSSMRVINALDGKLLDRKTLPARSQWLTFYGTRLIYLDEATSTVRCLSLRDDHEVWAMPFAGRTWSIDETSLATFTPQGRFAVIDLRTGREKTTAQLPAVEKMEDLIVLESFDKYLVFASVPSEQPAGFGQFQRGQAMVNGPCYAVGKKDGRLAWTRPFVDQAIVTARPTHLPLMTASRSIQESTPAPGGIGVMSINHKFQVQILNTRSSQMEFEEVGVGYFQPMLGLKASMNVIEFRTKAKLMKFDFSDE